MYFQDNVFLGAEIFSFLFFIQILGHLRKDWEGFGLVNNSSTPNGSSLDDREHYTIHKLLLFFGERSLFHFVIHHLTK